MEHRDLTMDVLVFGADGNRFGLDAAQIGEVLGLQQLRAPTDGLGGSRCVLREGCEIPVVELASVVGMRGALPDGSGKLVLPKSVYPDVCFLISDPEEMVRIPADDIALLPPPIDSMVRGSGIWGIARRNGQLVMLIDLVEAAQRAAS